MSRNHHRSRRAAARRVGLLAAGLLLAAGIVAGTVLVLPAVSRFIQSSSEGDAPPAETSAPISTTTPAAPYLLEIPYISQKDQLPTGCEVVSATMVLQHYGYELTIFDFVDTLLDKQDFVFRDGVRYGPHPAQAFVGSPYDPGGYGCYAPVIVRAINKLVQADGRQAVDLTGTALADLAQRVRTRQEPVLVWTTIDMQQSTDGTSWILSDTGESFTWRRPEHCMVLVGEDTESYYFQDPYNGNGLVRHSRDLAEKRFQEMGCQAVAVDKQG